MKNPFLATSPFLGSRSGRAACLFVVLTSSQHPVPQCEQDKIKEVIVLDVFDLVVKARQGKDSLKTVWIEFHDQHSPQD